MCAELECVMETDTQHVVLTKFTFRQCVTQDTLGASLNQMPPTNVLSKLRN